MQVAVGAYGNVRASAIFGKEKLVRCVFGVPDSFPGLAFFIDEE